MVVDAGKGIESQTRKLFEVCRRRGVRELVHGTVEEVRLGGEWLTVRPGTHGLTVEGPDLSRLYHDHFESLARA